jgi:hypothetical protein
MGEGRDHEERTSLSSGLHTAEPVASGPRISNRHDSHRLDGVPDSDEALGCQVNAIDPPALFDIYRQSGFLYPAKADRLAPFLPQIVENWRRGMAGGESIMRVVTYRAKDGRWASLSAWRSTHIGWNHQHIVSTSGPLASRAVVLAEAGMRVRDGKRSGALSAWFQRGNRYANRMFGSIETAVGTRDSSVTDHHYLALPLDVRPRSATDVRITPGRTTGFGLFELAAAARGRVYAVAEELDHDDLLLDEVDQAYRTVGLRRYRRVWLASIDDQAGSVGAAIAYRGPLGFNFSFLENRCDILLDPSLTDRQADAVTRALVEAAAPAYADFPLRAMPVVGDGRTARAVLALGAQPIRRYARAIWLRPGFVASYHHFDRMYQRRLPGRVAQPTSRSDGRPRRVPYTAGTSTGTVHE